MLSKRKRYMQDLSMWDFPEKNKRSIYLGKIADTSHDAYFDIDELTKHMVIAGSTGGGKTVTGQIIIEEAIMKGITVIVVDPTVQWTGFIRELSIESIKRKFDKFGMDKSRIRGFPANIISLDKDACKLEIKQLLSPGSLNILVANKLSEKELDLFTEHLLTSFFRELQVESQELKMLLVFDEIHRILPQYGGTGKGFLAIERGVREFQKWGIGLILISQILEDFIGQIRSNIGTEIQMRTSWDPDLASIKLKYGDNIQKSVVKAYAGSGMLHNSNYNIGQPFFVNFRPPYHDITRLSEAELKKYFLLWEKLREIEQGSKNQDSFELREAKKQLAKANFPIVEMYLEELKKG